MISLACFYYTINETILFGLSYNDGLALINNFKCNYEKTAKNIIPVEKNLIEKFNLFLDSTLILRVTLYFCVLIN